MNNRDFYTSKSDSSQLSLRVRQAPGGGPTNRQLLVTDWVICSALFEAPLISERGKPISLLSAKM